MKKIVALTGFLIFTIILRAQQKELLSPDGNLRITVSVSQVITWSLYYRNELLMKDSKIDMELINGKQLSASARVKKFSSKSVQETIVSPVPEKRKMIPDHYQELAVDFKEPFTIRFRAYNDGYAYRIETRFKDSVYIRSETAEFSFAENFPLYYPEIEKRSDADSFHTSFEQNYSFKPLDSVLPKVLAFTPVLIYPEKKPKLLVTESDLEDYPGMFVRGTAGNTLRGVFAHYPLETKVNEGGFLQALVTKRADYIARTKGTRTYPWRVVVVASEDKDLASTDIVYRLASPSRIPDATWVKPGKCTDEWTIGINLFDVPFKTGINAQSYMYYIDFAKRFGFDRIMMDAGWSDNNDLFKITPGLNLDSIFMHAKEKGIGISMWTQALTLNRQLDSALQQFSKWGVNFIMTDFIDRDDQEAVKFYFRVAEACAKYHIMIMYHGAYKPSGFGRTWPNAITRESVLGSEYNIWSSKVTPDHDLNLPFIRMVSGPLDYEPGLLNNAPKDYFFANHDNVMSMGTRCHQLAMFVIYDNPMQIFDGNPSQGLREPEFMELLGTIPTLWDETKIIDGKVGDYIITARKKGNDWFIGSMTDWTPRVLPLSLDFLDEGEYEATVCADGINADRYGADYTIKKSVVHKGDKLKIDMGPGGGYLLRLRKK